MHKHADQKNDVSLTPEIHTWIKQEVNSADMVNRLLAAYF